MTVGQLKNIISIIPDNVEVEADTGWECGPVPLGKGYLIKNKLIFIQDGYESQEKEYEANKAVGEREYKLELEGIIALLRIFLMATWDYNIAHRKHMGVMVEDVLNFLIAAMEERLEKEKKEDEEHGT